MKRLTPPRRSFDALPFRIMLLIFVLLGLNSVTSFAANGNDQIRYEFTKGAVAPSQNGTVMWTAFDTVEQSPHDAKVYGQVVTFRLTVPPGDCRNCMLYIDDIYREYIIYVNGVQTASYGSVDPKNRSMFGNPVNLIPLPAGQAAEVQLIVRGTVNNTGIYGPVIYGQTSSVFRKIAFDHWLTVISAVLTISAAFFNWMVYFPVRWDRVYLFFGLACLTGGIYILTRAEIIRWLFEAPVFWDLLEHFCLFLMPLMLWLYFRNILLTGKRWSVIPDLILSGFVVYAIVQVALLKQLPQLLIGSYNLMTAVTLLSMIVITIYQWFRRTELAKSFMGGLSVLLALNLYGIYDSIFGENQFSQGAWIGIVFVFTQLILLMQRGSQLEQKLRDQASELEMKNKDLIRLDKLKDEFVATTSHELRTPLNAIVGLSESMLEARQIPLHPMLRQQIQMIQSSGQRLNRLVNDILDFSQMRNETIKLSKSAVYTKAFVEQVYESLEPLIQKQEIRWENQVDLGTPVFQADPNRLFQVLLNIIDNAIKFSPNGNIRIWTNWDEQSVFIHIRDNGIGIEADQLDAIFEPFRQADASIEREFGGSGLGLAIARQIVHLHQGSIDVLSAKGAGTEFILRFPREAQTNQKPSRKPSSL